MSIWVVNTSALGFLGTLGRLELLHREGREVYIPRTVAEKPDAAAQVSRLPVEPGCRYGRSQIKRR
jgi:predicted nucleic acid-binding protein